VVGVDTPCCTCTVHRTPLGKGGSSQLTLCRQTWTFTPLLYASWLASSSGSVTPTPLARDGIRMASLEIPLVEGSSMRPCGSLEMAKSWMLREVPLGKVSYPSRTSFRSKRCSLSSVSGPPRGPSSKCTWYPGFHNTDSSPQGPARTSPAEKGQGPNKLQVHAVACGKMR
jgi:hypothetical protein